MRCKTCDHSLWNQPVPPEGAPRVCSECGTPYFAADFDFGRGKVRFCCPSCGTGYYGTSASGHLEPAEFRCVGCSAELTMDRCIIRAHDMEHESEAMQQREVPWIETRTGGGISRWWRTMKLGLTNTSAMVSGLTRSPQPLRAGMFVLVNAVIGSSMTIFFLWAGFGLRGGWFAPRGTVVDQIVVGVCALALMAIGIALFAAIPAVFCGMLTRKAEPIGFGRAYEIVAYSSGALVVGLVPCCGIGIAGLIWMLLVARGFEAALAGESLGKRILASLLTIVGFSGAVLAMGSLASAF